MKRRVKFFKWIKAQNKDGTFKLNVHNSSYSERVEDGEGFFLGFGLDFQPGDYGNSPFSIAILEREDGSVLSVPVEDIQFIKRGKH